MTSARDYNAAQLDAGKLTVDHITEMTRAWQAKHELEVDGKAGPKTIESIEKAMKPSKFLRCPLPTLPDGRMPQITSEFRPADRPDHNGVDWFYRWKPGDQPDFVGDKGCAGKNPDGTPKWVVPTGTQAIAAAAGHVMMTGDSPTGWRLWIDHGNGFKTGYFHLLDCRVKPGDVVDTGDSLGLVGDNPSDHDGRHLHFELSPVGSYSPMDPALYLLV